MPFTSEELSIAGKTSLEYYLKNKPVDQIHIEHPWMKRLNKTKKSMPGGKENAVIQLRYRYQNNFQFFNGRKVVTYNNRDSIEQALYPWRSAHDGFSLDEDRLIQNGITVTDNKTARHSEAESLRLTDLLMEQHEILRLGWEEQMELTMLRDGSQSTDAPMGLDGFVAVDPTTGTVGGIDRSVAANSWWRNFVDLDATTTTTTGTILDVMHTQWRNCTRNGGRPNYILAGSTFIDGYRNFMLKTYGRINHMGGGEIKIEGGTDHQDTAMMTFMGVPIIWCPAFADLDAADSPAQEWESRCYFLNMNYITLKPIQGQDMISRKPPRPYDRYEHYWGLTWRGALCMSRGNAHALITVQ